MQEVFYGRESAILPKVRRINKNIKKSFNQVERDLGYPRNALHNYKNGVEPSGIRLIELAHYFGVTPEYLLGINNDPKNNGTRIIFESLNDYQKKIYALFVKNGCCLQNRVKRV